MAVRIHSSSCVRATSNKEGRCGAWYDRRHGELATLRWLHSFVNTSSGTNVILENERYYCSTRRGSNGFLLVLVPLHIEHPETRQVSRHCSFVHLAGLSAGLGHPFISLNLTDFLLASTATSFASHQHPSVVIVVSERTDGKTTTTTTSGTMRPTQTVAAVIAAPNNSTVVSSDTDTNNTPTDTPAHHHHHLHGTTTTTLRQQPSDNTTLSSSAAQQQHDDNNNTTVVDFIGSAMSVKDLFALPYAVDRPISVALHNMGGTLLIDVEPGDSRVIRSQPTPDVVVTNFKNKQDAVVEIAQQQDITNHHVDDDDENEKTVVDDIMTRSLIALSTLETAATTASGHSEALTVVNSIIRSSENRSTVRASLLSGSSTAKCSSSGDSNNNINDSPSHQQQHPTTTGISNNMLLPAPEDYVAKHIPPAPEPREYLSWKFHGMNLLVGSDALIYRSSSSADESPSSPQQQNSNNNNGTPPPAASANCTALAIRVEDVSHMRDIVQQHQANIQSGTFIADHQLGKLQQMGKLSYAEAAVTTAATTTTIATPKTTTAPTTKKLTQPEAKLLEGSNVSGKRDKSIAPTTLQTQTDTPTQSNNPSKPVEPTRLLSGGRSFAAPDLDKVKLQTCIVPITNEPSSSSTVGGLLSAVQHRGGVTPDSAVLLNDNSSSSSFSRSQIGTTKATPLSPVSTVLDTYLDNIMANVPQLALCLREKGFIQSVKLLNTRDIPSRLIRPSTIDTSIPFEAIRDNNGSSSTSGGDPSDDVFSPQIMEMNAQALLRFLKANCVKDNATYLLRRDAGMTNIQLYDISSISAQRQQKWVWWLAMISYRFSHRLRHLSLQVVSDKALRRTFRVRQRSLLHNTLDLLETLSDMNGNKHESLIAAVRENLADTFLVIGGGDDEDSDGGTSLGQLQTTQVAAPIAPPPQAVSTHQPYGYISVDALSKAQDHLANGIKLLRTVLDRNLRKRDKKMNHQRNRCKKTQVDDSLVTSVDETDEGSSDSGSEGEDDSVDDNETSAHEDQIDPVVTQLFGMHYKLVNVSLRLAEIHMRNYWSSSAIQNLRTAANRTSDSIYLAQLMDHHHHNGGVEDSQGWLQRIQLQYAWLWEQCGHFARSFAADQHWRDRGHASGDDVICSLQDVEAAFTDRNGLNSSSSLLRRFLKPSDSLHTNAHGEVTLQSLSGIVSLHPLNDTNKRQIHESEFNRSDIKLAIQHLEDQKVLQRDERRVLVAASFAYSRALHALEQYSSFESAAVDQALIDLLRQRLGDACNETGKVMLNELRNVLTSLAVTSKTAIDNMTPIAQALCSSAEFWFLEGLRLFEECNDLRNLVLLRCNLCQCYKLRANAILAKSADSTKFNEDTTHAENCLQEAANHLQSAHEALEVRETDPVTWDMVSSELAATFLVLGVRRRQSLIGSGNNSLMILQALRLSPGKERSIVDPMERALRIYEEMGSSRQAAAAHYQLAQFFSKTWTCQRDEVKTREKLTAAFHHYNAAYTYFARCFRGDEATFCLLCLDLANLYSTVAGEECLTKALLCCLDAGIAFAPEVLDSVSRDLARRHEWFEKMDTIAISVEEQTFKILKSLVKFDNSNSSPGSSSKYKDLYRTGLTAKMSTATLPQQLLMGDQPLDVQAKRIQDIFHVIKSIKSTFGLGNA